MSDSFVTSWTVGCQAPLSMGFPRQEYWSGLPFFLQKIFQTQELNLRLLHWLECSLTLSHPGSPVVITFRHFFLNWLNGLQIAKNIILLQKLISSQVDELWSTWAWRLSWHAWLFIFPEIGIKAKRRNYFRFLPVAQFHYSIFLSLICLKHIVPPCGVTYHAVHFAL